MEERLRRKLRRLTAILLVSCVVIFSAATGALSYLVHSMQKSSQEQMQAETQEYIDRFYKQVDKEFQTLHALSALLETGSFTDLDHIADSIALANEQASFVSIAYFNSAGEGVCSTTGSPTLYEFPLQERNQEVQDTINRSLQGTDAISHLFQSEITTDRVYICSVPVYQEGRVAGVLATSSRIEIFADILSGNTVMGGSGYVHLLNAEGTFLIRTENVVIQDRSLTSIFDGPYLTDTQQEDISSALQNQERIFFYFEYDGEKFLSYLVPIGFNNWYLLCVDPWWGAKSSVLHLLYVIGLVLILISGLSVALLYGGYSLIRKNNKELLRIAYIDPVTGAENAEKFKQRLNELLPHTPNYSIAAVDIRNFKFFNGLFGADGGNRLLCYIKQTIEAHLKRNEFFCRESGDYFYLLLRDTDPEVLRARADALAREIGETTRSAQYSYEISLSCGIAVRGDMTQALLTLSSLKRTPSAHVGFYNNAVYSDELKKNEMESCAKTALANGAFQLFLQPKFELESGALSGAEALVRWRKEDGTLRFPGEFIPLFESNGFCVQLDMYMLEQVCRQLRTWMDAGIEPLPISVNQSRLLFLDGNYVQNLTALMEQYKIPSGLITLEILEGLAMDNPEEVNDKIRQLHTRGFRISMDDFGSGYSSLNTLYQLEIDELKLDRGFLQKVSDKEDSRRRVILEQIIRLAGKMGLSVVAEGIETQAHVDLLRTLRCDFGQGYFYSKPISAAEFQETYRARLRPAPPAGT